MDAIAFALGTVLAPDVLGVLLVATVVGAVIGAIPGMTVNMAVALAVPVSIYMRPEAAIVMLLALYCSGIYGGSISAILLNAPGTPASAATMLDGYPLARAGKAVKALRVAVLASFVGGIFSAVLLMLIAPQLASLALTFGPTEMAALLLLSLTIVAVLSAESMVKGLLAGALGMVLGTVGLDLMVGVPRLTFGEFDLYDGVPFIPLLIGLFAVAEVLQQAERRFRTEGEILSTAADSRNDRRVTPEELRRSIVPMLRGSMLGSMIGALPGLGASIASFVSYAEAKRVSAHPERFGKGAVEGVAASESANNAVTGSAMIPMLALSIPGDSVTAILLGALLIQGVTPGPLVFERFPEMVMTIYVALIAANLAVLLVGLTAIRPMSLVLRVPKVVLCPIILVMCVVGCYALRNSMLDVWLMLAAGVLGYVLGRHNVPPAPLLVAFILTRPFEEALRQALIASEGDPGVFVARPIAAALLALTLLVLLLTIRRQLRLRRP